jgi:nitroreductase
MLKTNRKTDYPVIQLILSRWSARSFSDEQVSETELMTLFDAARWAQNSFNNQPWRYIYSRNGSPSWQKFINLLEPGNQIWAKRARVLLLVVSKKTFDYDGRPSVTHTFDTGASAQLLSLQAASMDIICHGMEGFDYDRAGKELKVPDGYAVEAMFAIGKLGKKEDLPEKLQKSETPSNRKPLKEFIAEGEFAFNHKD